MACLLFRAVVFGLAGLAMASCSSMERRLQPPPVYDVREVAVIADQKISRSLIRGVDRRVSDAIAATHRQMPLPRVVLTVTINDVNNGTAKLTSMNEATFTVNATAVDNNEVVATGTFKVFSQATEPSAAYQMLAEEIAGRVRFAFGLTTPSVARAVRPISTTTDSGMPDADGLPAALPGDAANGTVSQTAEPIQTEVLSVPASSNVETGAKAKILLAPAGDTSAVVPADGAKVTDPSAGTGPCVVTATQSCKPPAAQ